MFMLYEIFIWNCFAKLLYFCMNVFFIGIRNSYLTLARLLCLICWFSSWVMLYYCETPFFFFIFWVFCKFFSISFFGWRNIFLTCPAATQITLDQSCGWNTAYFVSEQPRLFLTRTYLSLLNDHLWRSWLSNTETLVANIPVFAWFFLFFLPAPRKVSVKSRYSGFKSKNDWLLRAS